VRERKFALSMVRTIRGNWRCRNEERELAFAHSRLTAARDRNVITAARGDYVAAYESGGYRHRTPKATSTAPPAPFLPAGRGAAEGTCGGEVSGDYFRYATCYLRNMAKIRTIMRPAVKGDNVTLAEARAALREIKREREARAHAAKKPSSRPKTAAKSG